MGPAFVGIITGSTGSLKPFWITGIGRFSLMVIKLRLLIVLSLTIIVVK